MYKKALEMTSKAPGLHAELQKQLREAQVCGNCCIFAPVFPCNTLGVLPRTHMQRLTLNRCMLFSLAHMQNNCLACVLQSAWESKFPDVARSTRARAAAAGIARHRPVTSGTT